MILKSRWRYIFECGHSFHIYALLKGSQIHFCGKFLWQFNKSSNIRKKFIISFIYHFPLNHRCENIIKCYTTVHFCQWKVVVSPIQTICFRNGMETVRFTIHTLDIQSISIDTVNKCIINLMWTIIYFF